MAVGCSRLVKLYSATHNYELFLLSQPSLACALFVNSPILIQSPTQHVDCSLISRLNACMNAQSLSHVQFFATSWTVAHQAPLSMGFSRQEYCSGLPCTPPGHPPNPGIKPRSPHFRQILCNLSHEGRPRILEWVDCPFSRGSS